MSKLLIAVVQSDDAGQVVDALRSAEFRVTQVNSHGGFLKAGNVMLYVGVEDNKVADAMHLIEENCRSRTFSLPPEVLGGLEENWMPAEVTHGGATVLVVPLDEIRRI